VGERHYQVRAARAQILGQRARRLGRVEVQQVLRLDAGQGLNPGAGVAVLGGWVTESDVLSTKSDSLVDFRRLGGICLLQAGVWRLIR
jgi:hypothetical protein